MQPHMVSGYFAVMTSLLLRTQQPPQGIFGPNTLRAKMNRFAAALEQLAINRHCTSNSQVVKSASSRQLCWNWRRCMGKHDPDDPVTMNIREASNVEPLTKDEETNLFRRLGRVGDWGEERENVARRLVESQLALVVSIAQKTRRLVFPCWS